MSPDHYAEIALIEISRMQRQAMEFRPMAVFMWDELSMEIVEQISPSDVDEGWERQPDDGPVRVFFSDRGHVGLEVDAENAEQAHALFMRVRPYREMQE